MEKITYAYILKSEQETKDSTNSHLRGVNENIPKIFDVLFQLVYFTGPKKDVSTLEGEYHSYCIHQYGQIPYSFRASYILWESGYYLEGAFMIRYLSEILVKMRYLKDHKELIKKIWLGKKVKIPTLNNKTKNLTLKDIFEEVAPGYYDNNYAKIFSEFYHGGIGGSMFRVDYESAEKGFIKMGLSYDELGATFLMHNLMAMAYGYLNYFQKFFPEGFVGMDKDLHKKYEDSMAWIEKSMSQHKVGKPKSLDWYKEVDALIK